MKDSLKDSLLRFSQETMGWYGHRLDYDSLKLFESNDPLFTMTLLKVGCLKCRAQNKINIIDVGGSDQVSDLIGSNIQMPFGAGESNVFDFSKGIPSGEFLMIGSTNARVSIRYIDKIKYEISLISYYKDRMDENVWCPRVAVMR